MPPADQTGAPGDGLEPVVREVLRNTFGINALQLNRIHAGQETVNYQADTPDGRVFVKTHLPGADMTALAGSLRQADTARAAGIPVPQVIPTTDGQPLVTTGGVTVSVWEFVDGQVVRTGFTPTQLTAIGSALGTIHRTFRQLPESTEPSAKANTWRAATPDDVTSTIDTLIAMIDTRPEPDAFDTAARETLLQRRADVAALPTLLGELPALDTQVLHGDYSAVNLLFDDDTLLAVLDFSPPTPFLTSYELGRIAFDPGTIKDSATWIQDALTLIRAYQDTHPDGPPETIRWCARVILIQLLKSLYGVKNHYLNPGLLQPDLDQFWFLRHHAATRLLEELPTIEDALQGLA